MSWVDYIKIKEHIVYNIPPQRIMIEDGAIVVGSYKWKVKRPNTDTMIVDVYCLAGSFVMPKQNIRALIIYGDGITEVCERVI